MVRLDGKLAFSIAPPQSSIYQIQSQLSQTDCSFIQKGIGNMAYGNGMQIYIRMVRISFILLILAIIVKIGSTPMLQVGMSVCQSC
ncbi:hypothetical protein CIPAW_07G043900 [Carya illinoinensis]|uniref:Uncharacterized protein n=1 Tax=Carya illinoinensis TaxID=32201 RepID=A0A8T1PUT8_CARIL|nr:hypothetical protein CIPAW_07G043900 [Carya illinoinensis]